MMMTQLSLFGEMPLPKSPCNLESPSASQLSCRRSLQKYLSKRRSTQESSLKVQKTVCRRSKKPSIASRKASGLSLCKEVVVVNDRGRAIGQDHSNAIYLDADVENARQLREEGYTYSQISQMMDMPIRTIRGYLDGSRRAQSVAGWKVVKRWKKV